MKRTQDIPREETMLNDFSGFLARAHYMFSRPEYRADVSAENSMAEQLCEAILARANGVPRQHVIAALVVVVGEFMEEWREEEQLLTRPVQ